MKLPMKGFRDFIYYTQLGFSLVVPPLILIWFSILLRRWFLIGPWLTVVAIVVGIIVLCVTAYSFFKDFRKRQNKDKKKDPPTAFNSHE